MFEQEWKDMAFAYTKKYEMPLGVLWMAVGSFTNGGGDIGGDIVTGMSSLYYLNMQTEGAAVVANQSTVDETYPYPGSCTVVNNAGDDGCWMALGKH